MNRKFYPLIGLTISALLYFGIDSLLPVFDNLSTIIQPLGIYGIFGLSAVFGILLMPTVVTSLLYLDKKGYIKYMVAFYTAIFLVFLILTFT